MPGGNQQIVLSQFKNWKLNNKGLAEMLPAFYMFLVFYLVVLLITKAVQYLLVALAFALYAGEVSERQRVRLYQWQSPFTLQSMPEAGGGYRKREYSTWIHDR